MFSGVQFDVDEDKYELSGVGGIANNQSIHLNQMDPVEAQKIQKTEQAGLRAIQETDHPHPQDKPLNGKVTLGAPEAIRGEEKLPDEEDIPWVAVRDFPHLAWESIKVGLAQEIHSNHTLNGYINQAEKHQLLMDHLLDFSAELTALPDQNANPLTEKMKKTLAELRKNGVDLRIEDNATISKERKRELSSLVGSQVDKHRTDLQILFTTKIQVSVQNNSAIMETLKEIIKNNSRLISTITGHYANR